MPWRAWTTGRPWLRPWRALGARHIEQELPVIIARRIPFVTFRVLGTCGVVMHETFNQHMANADAALAAQAKEKTLLGYHDIRVGNEPDARLHRFVSVNLPGLVAEAVAKLDMFGDLLDAFASNEMRYSEFAARVRRRELGQKEDNDWEGRDDEDRDPYD